MFFASLYIIGCTAKNRVLVRLRRLREPRYLIGAIVGGAYIYFTFFARFRASSASAARRRARGVPPGFNPFVTLAAAGPGLAGIALMVVTAAAWLLPVDSGLLDFSESEVQFLFTAPVSRRSLLVHRMMRSQMGMLFGSVVIALVAPSISGYSRLRISLAMWLILSTGKIFFTGVSLARVRFRSTDRPSRLAARVPLAVTLAALAVVGRAVYETLTRTPLADPRDFFERIGQVASTGLPRILLFPFVTLARPLFAEWPGPFFLAFGAAFIVLAAVAVWVLQSDATFEDATEQAAKAREQSSKGPKGKYRARAALWQLPQTGRPEVAFAWKAAMQTFRAVDVRILIRVVAMLFALSVAGASLGQRNGFVAAFAMFTLMGSAFSVLFAPQAMRIDLRQDLQHLELIKMWPLRAADVVRGEMLWPGIVITAMAWTMMTLATVLSGAVFTRMSVPTRISLGLAAAIVAPGLAFAQLAIHNGMALLFPAWVALGNQRSRGLDAMGQRIITLAGSWLALIVLALPGVIAGGIVWFAARIVVGPAAYVPAAAVCCVILMIEVLVLTEMMGPAYERLDLLAVERAE